MLLLSLLQVADRELNQQDKSQGITRAASSTNVATTSSSRSSSEATSSSSSSEGSQEQQHSVPVSIEVLQQRTYFTRVACAHVAGLLTAFAANSITHLGQPALLYIVPSTLLTVLVTAASRSEVGRVWRFTDVATFGVPGKKE
jgi:minor histocompatibility antigen H13